MPIKIWAEDCSIVATLDWIEYSRNGKPWTAYLPVYLRSVLYCDLLNQDARYIKETLAEIFIQDYAQELFKDYRNQTLEWTIKNIRNQHTAHLKKYEAIKVRIDALTEEIESPTYSTLSKEWLEELEAKLMEHSATLKSNNAELLKADKENWNIQVDNQTKYIEKLKDTHKTLQIQYKNLKEGLEKMSKGICPTCKQETKIPKETIEELKDSIQEVTDKGVLLNKDLEKENQKLELLTNKALEARDKYNAVAMQGETLISVESYKERVIIYKERLLKLWKMLEQREELVNNLIELNDNPIVEAYKHIGPKGTINIKLSEEINKGLNWYEIKLFEESSRSSEGKAVFKIYSNGIEYKQLSKSEQLLANIMLSITILNKTKSNLPILIDDFESFSTKNKTAIIKLLNKNSMEYIIAEVKGKKLEVAVKDAVAW